ncbi:MAG: hypothetical protein RI907_2884 [Pseudomonadota bacterium]|jgi:hypothetical protein
MRTLSRQEIHAVSGGAPGDPGYGLPYPLNAFVFGLYVVFSILIGKGPPPL